MIRHKFVLSLTTIFILVLVSGCASNTPSSSSNNKRAEGTKKEQSPTLLSQNKSGDSKKPGVQTTDNNENSNSKKKDVSKPSIKGDFDIGSLSEQLAKQKLKAALASWAFGDTIKQFRTSHPGIQVFEPSWSIGRISGEKLLSYEIRNGRKATSKLAPAALGAFEFLVALQFQNRKNGNSITRVYHVQKNRDGSWLLWNKLD